MAQADRDGNELCVTSSYVERDQMLEVPGARWNKDAQHWVLPLTWAACLQLRGIFGAKLEVSEELQKWAWEEKENRVGPALALREELAGGEGPVAEMLDKIEATGSLKLKPFQRADAEFLYICGQAVLANQPGTGKTAVSIRVLQLLERMGVNGLPALVVCPNSLKNTVWAQELAAWAPELSVSVVNGNATQRRRQILRGADVTIINYEALRLHTREAGYGTIRLSDKQKTRKELNTQGYRTVICDEAHRLRHRDTQMTRSAWAVLHDAEFRFLLTGTPVNDHCGDLWGLLHGILPDWFPRYTRYLSRYAEIGYGWFGDTQVLGLKAENSAEFRAVTEPVMRRVLKAAVLPQLPPKLPPQIRETPMTPKQAKAYAEMEKKLLTVLDDGEMVAAPTALSQLTRMLQFAAAYAEINERGELRLKDPSAKVDDLIELLEEELDEEEPLVVAAVSRQLIELAEERLRERKISCGLVTGAISVPERARMVQEFQDGQLRVILLTLGAGAEGLTLTRASTMLFMQRSWSPLVNAQAEDRIHRIGSERHEAIRIIHQMTPDTVEDRVRELLDAKEERIEEIVRDRDTLRKLLGAEAKRA